MTMTKTKIALAILSVTLLAGCARSTPYAPAERPGGSGYTDMRISETRYRVTFRGNTVTSRETVENFLLLRAAEVTLDAGRDCFSFADRDTTQDVRYYTTFNDFGWYPRWRGRAWYWHNWGYGDPWGPDVDVRRVRNFEAYAEIIMGTCRNDDTDLNARQIVDRIGPLAAPPPPRS